MDTLDFAVRGGRMSRGTGMVAKLLNIKPVVEFAVRNEGKVDVVAKAIGVRRSEARLIDLLRRDAEGMTNLRFAIAHVGAPQTALRYAEVLKTTFGVAPDYIMPASAVLGTHSGPGACAVAMLGDRPSTEDANTTTGGATDITPDATESPSAQHSATA